MLAGAGVAAADDGSSSNGGAQAPSGSGDADGSHGVTSSPSLKATKAEKRKKTAEAAKTAKADKADKAETGQDPDAAPSKKGRHRKDADDADAAGAAASESTTADTDNAGAPATENRVGKHRAAETAVESATATVKQTSVGQLPLGTVIRAAAARHQPSTSTKSLTTDLGSPDAAVVMHVAALETPSSDASPPNLLGALNNMGTAFYDFYTRTMEKLAGPARAPIGSKVRVDSSTLTIGDGVDVPADWYFPGNSTPPTGLIYLQHGFLASATMYSVTAAYLAEKTNSIVVAPTLTWNPFDMANYPLEWPATGRAVADLFTGDRAALNASAQAAGYTGTLPQRVVLAGHSAGGGLIAMVARYMAENGNAGDLAGVLMFDGVGTLSPMSVDLAKIPLSIPVYNIAGQPSSWNWNGDTNRRLAEVRPGMFTGVTLKGGRHADAMQSGNPAVQLIVGMTIGFSQPVDVLANRVLAAGWVNDMFAGARSAGLYDGDGSPLDILSSWWLKRLTSSSGTQAARRTVTLSV
jgi:hypothetical protein